MVGKGESVGSLGHLHGGHGHSHGNLSYAPSTPATGQLPLSTSQTSMPYITSILGQRPGLSNIREAASTSSTGTDAARGRSGGSAQPNGSAGGGAPRPSQLAFPRQSASSSLLKQALANRITPLLGGDGKAGGKSSGGRSTTSGDRDGSSTAEEGKSGQLTNAAWYRDQEGRTGFHPPGWTPKDGESEIKGDSKESKSSKKSKSKQSPDTTADPMTVSEYENVTDGKEGKDGRKRSKTRDSGSPNSGKGSKDSGSPTSSTGTILDATTPKEGRESSKDSKEGKESGKRSKSPKTKSKKSSHGESGDADDGNQLKPGQGSPTKSYFGERRDSSQSDMSKFSHKSVTFNDCVEVNEIERLRRRRGRRRGSSSSSEDDSSGVDLNEHLAPLRRALRERTPPGSQEVPFAKPPDMSEEEWRAMVQSIYVQESSEEARRRAEDQGSVQSVYLEDVYGPDIYQELGDQLPESVMRALRAEAAARLQQARRATAEGSPAMRRPGQPPVDTDEWERFLVGSLTRLHQNDSENSSLMTDSRQMIRSASGYLDFDPAQLQRMQQLPNQPPPGPRPGSGAGATPGHSADPGSSNAGEDYGPLRVEVTNKVRNGDYDASAEVSPAGGYYKDVRPSTSGSPSQDPRGQQKRDSVSSAESLKRSWLEQGGGGASEKPPLTDSGFHQSSYQPGFDSQREGSPGMTDAIQRSMYDNVPAPGSSHGVAPSGTSQNIPGGGSGSAMASPSSASASASGQGQIPQQFVTKVSISLGPSRKTVTKIVDVPGSDSPQIVELPSPSSDTASASSDTTQDVEKRLKARFVRMYGNRKAPVADSESDEAPGDPKPSDRKDSLESVLSTDSRESVVSAASLRAENKVRRNFNY